MPCESRTTGNPSWRGGVACTEECCCCGRWCWCCCCGGGATTAVAAYMTDSFTAPAPMASRSMRGIATSPSSVPRTGVPRCDAAAELWAWPFLSTSPLPLPLMPLL